MYIDLIFSGYKGYILLRNLIILFLVISIFLNVLNYFKQNNKIVNLIIAIASLNALIINLWIINHLRSLLNETYELAIVFRENSNEELINGIGLNYPLLNQELFLSILSFLVLITSFVLIKKKSINKNNSSNNS